MGGNGFVLAHLHDHIVGRVEVRELHRFIESKGHDAEHGEQEHEPRVLLVQAIGRIDADAQHDRGEGRNHAYQADEEHMER